MDEESTVTAISFGTSYDHFSEKDEVLSLIQSLPHVFRDLRSLETSIERLTVIVDKYQEQPHLLDPHLGNIITKLFEVVNTDSVPVPLMHLGFKCIYLFSKTRGPKIIVRWFSHEVADLEPTLAKLQNQDTSDYETWETRYILLLWLYVISMIPFDLTRLDGSTDHAQATDHTHSKTINRLIEVVKIYLSVTDKSRDAAVLLCARLLSRPDVQNFKLSEFLEWAFGILSNSTDVPMENISLLSGVIKTLTTLFKTSKREDLLPYVVSVLTVVAKCKYSTSTNTLIRKQTLKLIQRLGMTFLPARQLSWRYGRGNRSLEDTLAVRSDKDTNIDEKGGPHDDGEEGEGFDVPEEVEEIIGQLLNGLRDKDTVVRWTAAKGIGRITGRLPLELANEIVGSLLDLFSCNEDDSGWHGGCLALAELGRRGLLRPDRLNEVVPVVLKALVYDERRGASSVGSHVRDAACYVCWSFARAYDPVQLKSHVVEIAQVLVAVMLFDREVNCRKAASAAFQENVGRQGTFPHGIAILTMADYFAVANISHVYLEVSVKVGVYNEYTRPLINHLVNYKIPHWDSSIRQLVAQALHKLTFLDPLYVAEEIFPSLIDKVTSPDLWVRHGSLCSVSEVMHSLHLIEQQNQKIGSLLTNELICRLQNIAQRLSDNDVFKGISGEIMRPAALKFIELCCMSNIPVNEDILGVWQSFIDDNIPHTQDHIREAAVITLNVLYRTHYCIDHMTITRSQEIIIPKCIDQMNNQNRFARMGFALSLGHLPRPILEGQLGSVLTALMATASLSSDSLPVYTEARRDAIRSITKISSVMCLSADGLASNHICSSNVTEIFHTLFQGMNDYTVDSRGDIGSVVREACVTGLGSFCIRLSDECPQLLTSDLVRETLCLIIQQCNEKIDRTRSLSCTELVSLITHKPLIKGLPHHQELLDIFNSDCVSDINWSVAQVSFPLTVQLLSLPSYCYHTLLGLIVSVGGLTESLVRYSSTNLLSFLKFVSKNIVKMNALTDDIIKLFDQNKQDTRIILPLLKTLDVLIANGVFEIYLDTKNKFPSCLLGRIKLELKGCRDPIKILASINTLCGLLQFNDIKESTLNQLMVLLGHSYPKVRRTAGDQLYVTLLTYDDLIPEDNTETILSLLSDTSWDGHIEYVRTQRNELCSILKLPVPKSKSGSQAKRNKNQDDMSYRGINSGTALLSEGTALLPKGTSLLPKGTSLLSEGTSLLFKGPRSLLRLGGQNGILVTVQDILQLI